MLDFKPTRASPTKPSTSTKKGLTTASSTISRASTLTVPELANLLPQDVELLDAVVERAGANATTFLTVFKAYNDILQERGLDPNEVVYYGKLLKLGTLKGQNWQDKWAEVKRQNGFESKVRTLPVKRSTTTLRRDDESFTLFSTDDGVIPSHDASDIGETRYLDTPRVFRQSSSPVLTSESTEDHIIKTQNHPLLRPPLQINNPTAVKRAAPGRASRRYEEPSASRPSTPPSYRTPTSGKQASYSTRAPPQPTHKVIEKVLPIKPAVNDPHDRVAAARLTIAQARQRRGSVINEEDAWKKIEMRRDEEEADSFYQERLMERCWDVWRQGFDWIITTNEQISEARDNIILQTQFQRWRSRTSSKLELYARIATISDNRLIRRMLDVWRAKLKVKRQNKWRQDMRKKMKIIRERRETNLQKEVWMQWRQLYRSRLAHEYYSKRLLLRFHKRWKDSLVNLDHLDTIADNALKSTDSRLLSGFWYRWRRALEIRSAEKAVEESVNVRIMADALTKWKSRMHTTQNADHFYDTVVMKRAIHSWKAARDRIHALDTRADKHLGRQDDILLRAVMRVWKARERGKLLERVKSLRAVKVAWATWQNFIAVQREHEAKADAFSQRVNSYDAKSALLQWKRAYAGQLSTHRFAVQYHSKLVMQNAFRIWRAQLREKLKLHRQARMVEKHLITRRAWNRWQERLAELRREKQLKGLETKRLARYYNLWAQRTHRSREYRIAEETMVTAINLRVMSDALNRWTNRVINVKLQELDVSQRRDQMVLSNAFNKWKTVCMRHVEELNLMESYQFVKREETLRRVYNRWLAAARASRHRRLILQKKEDQLKLATLSIIWDKWRGRFKAERLRPIEQDVVLQTQRNLLFRAFGIWHARTKSLPAIRFHASHIKSKYWEKWRATMPKAMLAKEAREKHRHSVLSFHLAKWLQVYRTKIALKAVARARYLRLPTSTPRQIASSSNPVTSATRRAFPQSRRQEIEDDSDAESGVDTTVLSKPYTARNGIAKLLSTEARTRNAASPRSPIFLAPARDPSPTRSVISSRPARSVRDLSPIRSRPPFSEARSSSPVRRPRPPTSVTSEQPPPKSRIWQELQEVRRRSRPPSSRG
ncbi:hypothetical protein PC9H_000797 [Pleurotus ostreatus]|uniref:Sfi1 spindle body domain-containing protein n=1 Tax=Pleurotus ostreatus TaxID=5322 RepID=A0A8H7DWX7_PLEOS|nr:uncharacterized protein PC9H_000797 [Pleurotus ostreatus]KAF7440452.1 hypothetical protein PC9H_000797 [Pleurotus ostreatus]